MRSHFLTKPFAGIRKLLIFNILLLWAGFASAQQNILTPDKIYGELFRDVQMMKIFPDNKTFVDCIPTNEPDMIVGHYLELKQNKVDKLAIEQFVRQNFIVPEIKPTDYKSVANESVVAHIKNLWPVLQRNPDKVVNGSSLLPLPNPYIVPGGRFREIYYWDSYFTMLGLQESDQWQMIENMIDNFSYLIQTFNHIPNGNRSYYLTRSQPPFFSLMVELLAEHKGDKVYTAYLSSLQKEYNYWMDQSGATQHVVQMPDKSILNRYYDAGDYPRQEGFVHDENLAKQVVGEKVEPQLTEEYKRVCRDLRSGAESGWDFSTRWFADGMNISTIQTTSILPVDLNALLYHLETTLAKAYKLNNQKELSHIYSRKAEARCKAMNKYFWSNSKEWFVDYNIVTQQQVNQLNAAGITPLFFKMASKRQAARVDKTTRLKFLRNGGFATTLITSGQQWDAPNGWAPLQWMAVKGLINYNKGETAKEIASRWIALNVKVYEKTGKLMEKYNIEDIDLEAGGGEYAGQDGFGWTNGVLLKLISIYGEPVK